MSVFGWGFFHSLLLHFVLILTKTNRRLNKQIMLVLLYLPSFINVILFAPFGFLAEKQYEMVPDVFGWRNVLPANAGQTWINIYYITYSVIAFILLLRWWKKLEPDTPLKKQVTSFIISMTLPFVLGSITDILPGVLGLTQLPRFALPLLIFPTVFLFLTLRRFGFLIERTDAEFLHPDSDVSEESRLRLFETAAAIFIIGAVGAFYTGYFIGKEPLANQLLLAAIVIALGILLRFIPYMSKKHIVQNTLFLIASIVGMAFFIITHVNNGAATVWAVYIIFLLYTIVLNSKIHTHIFLAVTLAIQAILSMVYPELSITIGRSRYLERMFIIVLSYFAVKYLTNEYNSKLRGYQRFSKEQETLEKISTSFISVNKENAKEKIDEMFKLSAEILNFDNAYLFEFDENYEKAMVLNVYTKAVEDKLSVFGPGTSFQTADFPEVNTLISQNLPILCEDVAAISADEAGSQREFFMSRGINSFFALPIVMENKADGFFVIEYKERSDERFTESRLNFLKIITNILGDTKQKVLYEEMIYDIAYFDESTKLANRNMLMKKLGQDINDIKDSEKIAVFNIELENLRMIKDGFGHNVVEQVMVKSAKMLESLLGNRSDIFRTSEGEFVVILHGAKNFEQIEEHANKLLAVFSQPISTDMETGALFVAARIGVSVYPDDGRDAKTLLKNADLAGYEAIRNNEDIVFYAKRLEEHIAENTLFTNKLFRSLQNKEFFLEYQPQVSCNTGKTVGVEALLRWTIEDDRRVPPDRFIPILEQTGLIYDVGLWVLEQALLEHNRLIAKGFPPLRFSVNLSVVQFEGEDFISDVAKIIKESRVDPKYIELEITESLLSENLMDIVKKLSKLKEIGISLAIDDFGKGYSSLHRLEMVPFDRIKIDKSIVDDIVLKKEKIVIVKTIISLAKDLMASVTAEGVETKEQLDFLKSMACDEIQGFYFSKPLPPEALEEFLKKEHPAALN